MNNRWEKTPLKRRMKQAKSRAACRSRCERDWLKMGAPHMIHDCTRGMSTIAALASVTSTKSSFVRPLTCRSRVACFDGGSDEEFIEDRVSRPVCTTIPQAMPEARTVFAHSVFSRPSGSVMHPLS